MFGKGCKRLVGRKAELGGDLLDMGIGEHAFELVDRDRLALPACPGLHDRPEPARMELVEHALQAAGAFQHAVECVLRRRFTCLIQRALDAAGDVVEQTHLVSPVGTRIG